MPPKSAADQTCDPRIRRTRKLLQQALDTLLKKKNFDEISVGDIAEAATVNRATFYDHYADKFALLECLVADRFFQLLTERQVQFDAGCDAALQATVLALCDYLVALRGSEPDGRPLAPHMETAILSVLRHMFLDGIKQHTPCYNAPPEMVAAALSWAIYGAAKEWAYSPDRPPAEQTAATVARLVSPILTAGT